MRIDKTVLIFIFLLGCLSNVRSQNIYSLNDLYKVALERAEDIKISEEDLYITERGKDKAIADLLPTLSAFGEYTKFSESKEATSGFSIQPDYSTSWGLRLDQSLSLSGREFTGFGIAGKKIMKSRFNLNAVKEDYLLSVASAYYEVLKAKREMEIANSNVDRLIKHRDAARIRLEVGEVTKTVLLRANAELASAQSDLIRAENTLKLSKAILGRIVGIGEDYELKETVDITQDFKDSNESKTIESLKQTALSERVDLKAVELQKKIAEDEVKYARGLYWPTLSIEGVYFREKDEPSSSFEIKERIYGGIKIDFPFFEGGLRRAEVREAKAKQRQSVLDYEDIKKTIFIEVEEAYLDFITQKGVLKSFEDQLTFAKDNYNLVSKQFKYGLVNSIDVMDANTLLVTAERELANAKYDYQLAILRLRRATGTFLKAEISQ